MSVNRIQKLLFSEYCDFEDMVLVESPFAQTTREGKGIRQVHLGKHPPTHTSHQAPQNPAPVQGLTPTKLILATDKLLPANEAPFRYLPGVDPDVETFELIAVYPLECVALSVFHRRKHKSLKAHFCTNRVLYFELGGFQKRRVVSVNNRNLLIVIVVWCADVLESLEWASKIFEYRKTGFLTFRDLCGHVDDQQYIISVVQ